MDCNQIGKQIKKLRQVKNLSQEALAKEADIPYTTLTKIESGVIKSPSVYTIAKIAEALDSDVDSLIKGGVIK
jgi:transcriptional regulator with XRE-family HTH domain